MILLGYQPRAKMAEINASSDVATIIMDARVEDDGFPSKIYTTMACARPSIVCCSEDSELVRIVRESKCGRWARPGQVDDYIAALMAYRSDPNLIATEGAAGRAFVEARYSRKAVAGLYHTMIREVVGSDRGQSKPSSQ
jgi:glycosyltransferase involved in cell wall biosynthesis